MASDARCRDTSSTPVRDTITHSPANKLKDYIEFGGKGKDKPLSYSSIEKNRELSLSAFGGKQNYEFWQIVFETGKTPQGQVVMPQGINLIQMLQRAGLTSA